MSACQATCQDLQGCTTVPGEAANFPKRVPGLLVWLDGFPVPVPVPGGVPVFTGVCQCPQEGALVSRGMCWCPQGCSHGACQLLKGCARSPVGVSVSPGGVSVHSAHTRCLAGFQHPQGLHQGKSWREVIRACGGVSAVISAASAGGTLGAPGRLVRGGAGWVCGCTGCGTVGVCHSPGTPCQGPNSVATVAAATAEGPQAGGWRVPGGCQHTRVHLCVLAGVHVCEHVCVSICAHVHV